MNGFESEVTQKKKVNVKMVKINFILKKRRDDGDDDGDDVCVTFYFRYLCECERRLNGTLKWVALATANTANTAPPLAE